MVGLSSDYPRIVFILAEAIQRVSAAILNLKISWQAQYLLQRLTLLAPRILNDVSYVTRINHEMHFAWQAQYLVKLECNFSWQAQHLVTFWEIAGARNVVFFNKKSSPRSDE